MSTGRNVFASALWLELQRREFTPAMLARLLDKPPSTVSRWLSGETLPDLATRLQVAQLLESDLLRLIALGLEMDEMFRATALRTREAVAA